MTAPQWSNPPTDRSTPNRLDSVLHHWLAHRAATVEPKTLRSDQDLLRLIPHAYLARELTTIGPGDVAGILGGLKAHGLSELSIRRRRVSLSTFFAWCARSGLQVSTPVMQEPEPASAAVGPPSTAGEPDSAWEESSELSRAGSTRG